MNKFRLIMISAMNENGGNILHRFLDGHPNLFVYPFESQLGTHTVSDYLASLFQKKYRWPQFDLNSDFAGDYENIWDQELKTRVKTPQASKFKGFAIDLDDRARKKVFLKLLKSKARTRANIVEAFLKATFISWKNFNSSGKEKIYVGYSPIVVIDSEKIMRDFPNSKIIHVVRNPFSAYAETKKRPAPQNLDEYIWQWNIVQSFALGYEAKFPKNVVVVRYEDMIRDPKKFFQVLCKKIEISFSESLNYASVNGNKLDSLYPWGTIEEPNENSNLIMAKSLTAAEKKEIAHLAKPHISYFKYQNYS